MIPEKCEDAVLADTLRREDPEQFYTLVRMHLSFVLDLNTDECDGSTEKTKFRSIKWSFPSFAKRNKAPPKEPAETTPLTPETAERVFKLIEWLSEEKNVIQEGIFRRSGKMTRQQELRNLLIGREPLILDSRFSVHDGASVLKNFLAQLPEPLLTEAHYPAHCQIAEICASKSGKKSDGEEERLLKALQLMSLLLPTENLALLRTLMKLLHLTASHVAQNKMSADNLATLFTPHLLCPRRLTPEALHTNSQIMAPVLSFMIIQCPALFDIPTQLATDIRAYLNARQAKGMNESVCDSLAAKTVFTFVDRERTAEASGAANPTEAALAQLYAHIQSLPESSKKKKLIKQFNKENGQGTPQLQGKGGERMSRTRTCCHEPRPRARSRSIGDSIKKHMPVFNKAPKRRKDNGEELSQAKESPCSGSPMSKVKVVEKKLTDDNLSETSSTSMTGSGSMPALKKSLFKSSSSGSEANIRIRLSAKPRRTPLSLLTQNTMAMGPKEPLSSPKRCSSSSSSGSTSTSSTDHLEPEDIKSNPSSKTSPLPVLAPVSVSPTVGTPFRLPLLPTPDQPSVYLKQVPGSDDICPVSTAYATGASATPAPTPAGSTNSLVLTTPQNCFPWITSTPAPACIRLACPLDASGHNSCLLTPSNTTGNSSMSPITRSTQKMPKSMQENMMTPRSRKPVVALSSSNLCQLAHLGGWGQSGTSTGTGTGELLRNATNRATLLNDNRNLARRLAMMHEEGFADLVSTAIPLGDDTFDPTGMKNCSGKDDSHCCTAIQYESTKNNNCKCGNACDKTSLDYYSCGSGVGENGSASIAGTFREYLMSRSVLTASPVDLSFSSRTGDFDTSSDRELKMILSTDNMSESLRYCLDGNKLEEIYSASNEGKVKSFVRDEFKRNENCSDSDVEATDDGFGSGSISMNHSLNTAHDSINTGGLTSVEKLGGVNVDNIQSINGLPFSRSISNDDGIAVLPEGCLANLSASLV